jgi:adhesin HecA-like repeat protein
MTQAAAQGHPVGRLSVMEHGKKPLWRALAVRLGTVWNWVQDLPVNFRLKQGPAVKRQYAMYGSHSQQGSLIVYLALALVAFGILAMAGMTRFGASVTSVLSPNCATEARYMAEAGTRYASARLRACTTSTQAQTAASDMNSHGTYMVNAAKGQGFTLTASYSSGTAFITSIGTGCPSSLSSTSSTLTSTINLPSVGSAAATSAALQGTYSGASGTGTAGTTTGNVATTSLTIGNGSIIGGSYIYLGTGSSCLTITGGEKIGTLGTGSYACSDTCAVVSGGSIINGNLYSQGSVTVTSGTVNGDIYAKGAVTITSGAVNGTVYAQGNITIQNGGAVSGNIYSGGNVSLDWPGNSPDVTGNIYAVGTLTLPSQWAVPANFYKGQYIKLSSASSIPTPDMCANYTLPAHKNIATTAKINLHSGDTYTFFGSSLADTSNAYTSISADWGSKICFDLSTPNTYINIFNSGNIQSNAVIYVRTSTATSCFDSANDITRYAYNQNSNSQQYFPGYTAASRVYTDVQGTMSIADGRVWFGTVFAGGNIYPGSTDIFDYGAFYTNQNFNPNNYYVHVVFVPSKYVNTYWP